MDTVRRVETGFTYPVQMFRVNGVQPIDRDELRSSGVHAECHGQFEGATDRFHESEEQRISKFAGRSAQFRFKFKEARSVRQFDLQIDGPIASSADAIGGIKTRQQLFGRQSKSHILE